MSYQIQFSIIVPNYNKAPYIEDCLNSIFCQKYKNYEVIVVDDGSTDNSVEVIKKFDVTLLHTNRLQAGGARNLGLEHCHGDYVVFIDSDDYLDNDLVLEKLASLIHDEDLIFLNYTMDNFGKLQFMKEEKEDILLKIENSCQLGCPTKCFKRSLIEGIKFPEKQRYEDMPFTIEAMCRAKTYTYFEESFFVYRRVAESNTTKEIDANAMIDVFEGFFQLYRLILKYPKYKIPLLNKIKSVRLPLRLDILNELLETGKNTFKEHF